VWGVDDGLPSSYVSSIAQTPDGYLWVATDEGLARFDGVRFTPFFASNTPGLQSDHWQTVFTDHAGNLWVGMEGGGISRMSEKRFEVVAPVPPRRSPRPAGITSIAEDASGAVWFGYSESPTAARWQNGRLTFTDGIAPGRNNDLELRRAGNGTIWYAKGNKCGLFDGRQFREIDKAMFIRLAPAKDGKMWALREGSLVKYGSDCKWESVADLGALGAALHIRILYEDHGGDLWLGTSEEGLFRFRNGSLVHVPTSHTSIRTIFEDREGNIWVGTGSGGLNCLQPRQFFLREAKYSLSETMVISVCEDIEGKLWLLNRWGTLVRSLDAANSTFASPPGLDGLGHALALCPDPSGGVWLGILGGGVKHWNNGEIKIEHIKESTTALLVDRKGDLWVAPISGPLLRLHQGVATRLPVDGGMVDPRALAEDNAGRLWVGTEDGLVFRKENDEFIQVPLPGGEAGGQVRFIVADGDQVWIGLERTGIYRWRAGKIDHLLTIPSSPMARVRSLLIDRNGEFWIGTAHGLCRVHRYEIEAAAEREQNSIDWDWFGPGDGLPHLGFCFGFRSGAVQTHDGHLWFATYSGALEINPLNRPKVATLIPVTIEEAEVAGKTLVPLNEQLTLNPTPGTLQIHYTLPELSDSERIRFRYRLVGLGDGEWFSPEKQRVATFTNLPPGRFRFEVQARQPGGEWLPPAAITITVPAAWWQTWWFRSSIVILGIFASGFIARGVERRRLRARMRTLEQERAVERERARIARDIHDELGANLTQITLAGNLAKIDEPKAVPGHINEITSLAARTVDLLDEIVWAVNPHNDTLFALTEYLGEFAPKFLSSSGINCSVEMPDDLPLHALASDVRHHLFLVAKETLNNIVKHAKAQNVRLSIGISDSNFHLAIIDDGQGFELGSEGRDANGLRNMRERMAEIGGEYRIDSQLGHGTRVFIQFPLPDAAGSGKN
jgi:signal transduction histidine kinase/streptogramin lyase